MDEEVSDYGLLMLTLRNKLYVVYHLMEELKLLFDLVLLCAVSNN
jgi:hypothetical protein